MRTPWPSKLREVNGPIPLSPPGPKSIACVAVLGKLVALSQWREKTNVWSQNERVREVPQSCEVFCSFVAKEVGARDYSLVHHFYHARHFLWPMNSIEDGMFVELSPEMAQLILQHSQRFVVNREFGRWVRGDMSTCPKWIAGVYGEEI